eukprot:CAMPEP_0196721610 /NCGR_PEP_ID=MMETSP1091-20130531/4121_1 /TAXON_ID=302021 /ORGANISM="Rhodomonas sp., Strain CCMP768" /LENGTH=61 /DNA_ID=CAMNT_0042063111 /DNA_START=37 /DNA_END=218 /DNA_ORIENTATION=+
MTFQIEETVPSRIFGLLAIMFQPPPPSDPIHPLVLVPRVSRHLGRSSLVDGEGGGHLGGSS